MLQLLVRICVKLSSELIWKCTRKMSSIFDVKENRNKNFNEKPVKMKII